MLNATAIAVEESPVFSQTPGSLVICVLLLRNTSLASKLFLTHYNSEKVKT